MKAELLAASVLLLATVSCRSNTPDLNDGSTRAIAYLVDTDGHESGKVTLTERPGTLGVEYAIEIVHAATPGQHGLHFHAVGSCNPIGEFASAGDHFNPGGKKHGLATADGPHAGDLEAITIDIAGRGTFRALAPRVTLTPGPNSLLDADGSAIVLHALPDDQRTDPSGNSGARNACGVIVKL